MPVALLPNGGIRAICAKVDRRLANIDSFGLVSKCLYLIDSLGKNSRAGHTDMVGVMKYSASAIPASWDFEGPRFVHQQSNEFL